MPNEWAIGKKVIESGVIWTVVKVEPSRVYLENDKKEIWEMSWKKITKLKSF